jgi:hypothetical protein
MSDTTPEANVAEWVPAAAATPVQAMPAATTPAAAKALITRGERLMLLARNAANGLVPHARYQLIRLGPAGVTGAAAAAGAAAVVAFSLLVLQAANTDLNSRILQAQHRHEAPIPPEQGLTRVIDQLPARAQIPTVLGQVLLQAQAAGIELAKGQYSYRPAAKGALARYELDFPITAQYPAIRDFINRILTNIPAAGLYRLTIQRKVVGDAQVNADVRFFIFVRER